MVAATSTPVLHIHDRTLASLPYISVFSRTIIALHTATRRRPLLLFADAARPTIYQAYPYLFASRGPIVHLATTFACLRLPFLDLHGR